MTVDERSLQVLTKWSSRKYENDEQKIADLQCLIITALKQQDIETRHACEKAIIIYSEDMSAFDFLTTVHGKCANVTII